MGCFDVVCGMEGFILAAGLGTRLRPLTDDRPKALVEVGGEPLLALAIRRLASAGASRIVVNVHHFADMVEEYLASHAWPCPVSISDERALLLDTGGALKHAEPHFSGRDDILIHNVDVLSTIDLSALLGQHASQRNLATLCCSRRDTKRLLDFGPDGSLLGRTGSTQINRNSSALAFSGIALVSPALLPLLPVADHPYSIIDMYIELASSHPVRSFVHPADQWLDVGRPETLEKAQQWYPSCNK